MIDKLHRQLMAERHTFIQRDGKGWLEFAHASSTEVARMFRDAGGRLITITGFSLSGEEIVLYYHFDVGGFLYTVRLETADLTIGSITPIMPAAEWIEREIQEYYGVTFSGHPRPLPLLLARHEGPSPLAVPQSGKVGASNP